MGKIFKRTLATIMVVLMVLTSSPLSGFVGINFKAEAATITSYKTGDIIEFGWYPQSKVTDPALISSLNSAGGQWVSYNYYSGTGSYDDGKMTPSDYMRYKDVIYGSNKYRGIIFDSYRPYFTGYTSSSSNTYQEDNGYSTNTVYWFKYEPIKWRVLDPSAGMVMSETILDSQPYNNYILSSGNDVYGTTAYWGDSSKKYYANNYAKSSLRQWLNNDFYNTAFSPSQQNIIESTALDNSSYSSEYSAYDSPSTSDKIYLLSYNETKNSNYGFSSSSLYNDTARCAKGSDYAQSQGLYVYAGNSHWFLRSSGGDSDICVASYDVGSLNGCYISYTVIGIRPALNFNLYSEILQSDVKDTGNASGNGAGSSNTNISSKNQNQKITITPKDATSNFNGDSSTSEFLRKAFEKLKNVTVHNALGISANIDSYTAQKSEIETENMTLTCDNFYDYIIPKEVISSWSTNNGVAYKFDALMQKDKKDGKPYVSTVFGRESGEGAYKELKSDKLSIYQDDKYDIIISAGGLNGKSATYYISQDNAHKISNLTGVFDSQILHTVLDYNKDTYVYFVTSDGVTSDPVKVNIVKCVPQDDNTKNLLNGSEISLIGPSGQKIKISDDFPLVGGAEISLEAFKFPYMGVDVNGDNVKISLGIDVFSTKASDSKKRETIWLDYKKGIKTLGDKYKDSKDALKHYRNFAKTFIDKNGLKQVSYNDKSNAFNLSLLGYLEGTIVNGKIIFKEVLIKIEGKFTFKYTQQGAIWIIPAYVYVEASAKVGLTGNRARQFADTNIPLDFGLMLDIEPALKVGAGAGVKDAASLGLWGKGSLPYHNDFSEKYHNLYLKGEFGWEAEFFIVSAEGTLLKGDFKLLDSYYGNSKRLLRSPVQGCLYTPETATESTQPKVSVVSRDYVEDTSEWLGEYPISLYSLADNGVSFNVLQTDIFDQTNSQLVSFGDKVMMTWIQDDTSRDTYNRMRLVYSLYDVNNSTWSEPKAVYDDGHNDAYPSLATDGENVYVTWQKIDKTVTESNATSVDVFLENSEIYVAKYDAVNDCFINATKLTDNEVYDYIPSVIVNNGNAVVYYATNSNNNLMGTDNNTLNRYELGETSEVLAEKQSYIISATPEIVNDTEKLSYSVDTDGDMSTSNDITVYTISNGKTTSFDKDENEVAYTFADYSMLDGTETLFVSDMNNIYYEQNGETKTVFNGSRLIEGNISFVEQETGLSILWTENNEVGGNEFWTTSYEDGAWTEPVQISSIGSFKVSKVDVAMLGGKLVGVCNMNEMTLDEESGTYTEGAANLCSFTANEFTDISLDIYMVDESKIIPGETSSIDVYVNNVGTTDVTSIEFAISDTLGTDTTVTKEVNIKSGATELVTLDYLVPKNYTATTLTISASIPDVEESDTEDNTESIEIGKGDLSIIESELVNFGDNYILKAVVENNSSVDAEGVIVSTIFNDSEEEPFEQSEIGALAKEQYVDYELAFNKELVDFDENGVGKLYIKVTSTSDESADGDNMICVAVTLPQEAECAHPLTETIEAKQATCFGPGYSEYEICSACSEKVGYEEIPAINHANKTNHAQQDATCTELGYTAGTYCPDCEYWIEGHEEIPAINHANKVTHTQQDATCTSSGYTAGVYCPDCEQWLEGHEEIEAIGHKHTSETTKAATCKDTGLKTFTCSCGDTYTETISVKEHSEVIVKGKAATCTATGLTDGKKCSVCGTVTVAQKTIAKKAHTLTTVKGKAATCTKTGLTEGKKCSDCGTVTVAQKTIAKKAHTLTTVKGKATTCTATGLTDGKKCSVCGTVTVKQETIAKKAHTYKTVTTKASLSKNGKVESKCSVCGYVSKTTTVYYPKTIKLSATSYAYNGKTKTPTVTVKDSKGNTLKKDTDYTVKYESGRKLPGKYSVTITFKGKYSGTKTLYFTITPKLTSKVSATQTTTSVTLKWSKVTGATGYRVFQNVNGKWKTLTNTTKLTYTIKKLKAGTNYTFAVRPYTVDGTDTILSAKFSQLKTATMCKAPSLKVASTKKGIAALTWTNVAGESGYQVYYSTKKDSGYKELASYKTNVVKGSKSKLTSKKTYYFKVRAYTKTESGTVYSAWSSVKSVKVK